MTKKIRNIAASIRQKLKNKATQDKRLFAELLQYYAMERFLYCLTQSEYAALFILKGALMLRVWKSPEVRPTMDIDMLAITNNEVSNICIQVAEIIAIETDDGLVFDPATIRGEIIKEDADYEGVRVRFIAYLDNARVNMQLDIGFGDIVYPEPVKMELPNILDLPAPRLLCYSRESAIAEKFEAMIKLGEMNSRMKDFYDIWLLSRQFEFNGADLAEAIKLTFEHRGTKLSEPITAFTDDFVKNKQVQWRAFQRRLGQKYVSDDFFDIIVDLKNFLQPIVSALKNSSNLPVKWIVADSWL